MKNKPEQDEATFDRVMKALEGKRDIKREELIKELEVGLNALFGDEWDEESQEGQKGQN